MKSAEGSIEATVASEARAHRRVYTPEQRLRVVMECQKRGASIAGVALRHGINANVVRKWIVHYKAGTLRLQPAMLPVVVDSETTDLEARKSNAATSQRPAERGEVRIEFGDLCIIATGTLAIDAVGAAIRATLSQ